MIMRMLARRLFNGRQLGRRLRRRLEYSRPFPLPQYTPGTPRIAGRGSHDVFLPPNPSTLEAAALEGTVEVSAVLAKLTQFEETVHLQTFYREGRESFGKHWRYADLLTVLWAAASLSPPTSYLEIGVRTGFSTAVVGATAPNCDIYGFDLWTPDYAGLANPGPEFVRGELRTVGHEGKLSLISGNSRETLPAFLREHPDLYFDLITIDGDKSVDGAASDLANALPRLKLGGVIVSDDINLLPHLRRVWHAVITSDMRYVSWEFKDGQIGVATAVRMSDEPITASLFDDEVKALDMSGSPSS